MKAVHAGSLLRPDRLEFSGGHATELLCGGDALFPAMQRAIAQAQREVWLASYIFHDDEAGQSIAEALNAAASRGVQVRLVLDGFGSKASLPQLAQWFAGSGVQMLVFRPLQGWRSYFQPSQLRRLHQKLCTVDGQQAFVGGINVIDDRNDLHHGRSAAPRLDFAVALQGPVVQAVQRVASAVWQRELWNLAQASAPVDDALRLLRGLRGRAADPSEAEQAAVADSSPVRAAFVVRDNFRQRRAIERAYVEALLRARERIEIICPYFYPGHNFRRALLRAARRGVNVRLLLQGKVDYRIAALAARVHYEDLLRRGVRIFEYTPAFLHAKVATVDDRWATVGSSNIDPISLLLNLEANVVIQDSHFATQLRQRFDEAVQASREVSLGAESRAGWRGWLARGLARGAVAWLATLYLRLAGVSGRY
jgi:cardiolipin synthase A/B